MSAYRYACSRPHESIIPRPHRDAHQRFLAYGPVVGMDEPRRSLVARLLGWR